MIILDTNVVSEPTQLKPSARVMQWLADQNPRDLFTTVITEAEMLYGAYRLEPGRKRDALEAGAHRLFTRTFADHVLPFDRAAAHQFAHIAAARKRRGKIIGKYDTQIAAIARAHNAIVATRDVDDFELAGVQIINPWTA